MREIVPQVMKREIGDEVPLLLVGLPFEGAEPMVNAIFRKTWTSLGGKDVDAFWVTPTMLEVVVEGTTRFVEQINIPELFPLVSQASVAL